MYPRPERSPAIPMPTATMSIEVLNADGRSTAVHFAIVRDDVEIWLATNHSHGHRCAIISRPCLREWLKKPDEPLHIDDVTLNLDHMLDRLGRIAITLPGVTGWALSPMDTTRLRERV